MEEGFYTGLVVGSVVAFATLFVIYQTTKPAIARRVGEGLAQRLVSDPTVATFIRTSGATWTEGVVQEAVTIAVERALP